MGYPLKYSWISLVAQLVKNCLQWGRPGFDTWVGKIPWRREQLPTPVFWPGEFHGLCSQTQLSHFLFQMALVVKNPQNRRHKRQQAQSPYQEDPMEDGMAIHSSILAQKILWTEEPGRLQSIGLQGIGHH